MNNDDWTQQIAKLLQKPQSLPSINKNPYLDEVLTNQAGLGGFAFRALPPSLNSEYNRTYPQPSSQTIQSKADKISAIRKNLHKSMYDEHGNFRTELKFRKHQDHCVKLLKELDPKIAEQAEKEIQRYISPPRNVFLVHGHDEAAKHEVARWLEKQPLGATILSEQINSGRTIITKLLDIAKEVDFAVILLTPDDIGKSVKKQDYHCRARQNVIFELGLFIGKLGIDRVAILKSGNMEDPSDYQGVVYIFLMDMVDGKAPWQESLKLLASQLILGKFS